MPDITSVCVYCGSRTGEDTAWQAAAASLGAGLADRGMTLVFGGGRVGLMGAVADAALDGGGTVVGIIPESLENREVGHANVSELHVVANMHERKMMMAKRCLMRSWCCRAASAPWTRCSRSSPGGNWASTPSRWWWRISTATGSRLAKLIDSIDRRRGSSSDTDRQPDYRFVRQRRRRVFEALAAATAAHSTPMDTDTDSNQLVQAHVKLTSVRRPATLDAPPTPMVCSAALILRPHSRERLSRLRGRKHGQNQGRQACHRARRR